MEPLKRTILYYPTISIPTGRWLRQALLYWDEVGSIVPKSWEERALIPFHPDLDYLRAEGEFRPFRPEDLIKAPEGEERRRVLEKEFIEIVTKSPLFNGARGNKQQKLTAHIYEDKVSSRLYSFLENRSMAKMETSGNRSGWFLFEEKAAHLYMSLLAKHLAALDYQFTTCGTDKQIYEKLNFAPLPKSESVRCPNIWLHNILPAPREDVSFADIIQFKQKRRAELLRFRREIDKFQREIAQTSSEGEITEVLVRFKESIEVALSDLNATLHDHRIATRAGSLKTILNAKSPTLWGAVALAAGHATKIAELPLKYAVSGLVTLGLVEVRSFLVDKRNEKNAKLRESSISYLLQARSEHVI